MIMQTVIHLFTHHPTKEKKPLPGLMKHLGQGRFDQRFSTTPAEAATDPYLLLLLANQELVEGREEQARCLVEAAYEFFDQKSKATRSKLYLAG
jgi:hypothetical protein